MGLAIGGTGQTTGTWRIGTRDTDEMFSIGPVAMSDGRHLVEFPSSVLNLNDGNVIVEFENGARGDSRTVIFHGDHYLELLVPAGEFAANMIRSLVVIFCYLVVLAALGVTAGILFSFPVATFAAFSLSAIVLIASFFAFSNSLAVSGHHHHDHGDHDHGPSLVERVGEHMLEGLEVVLSPVKGMAPLGHLSDGVYIPAWTVMKAVLILGVLCPGVLGLLGGYCMSRRELAAN